MAGLHHKKVNAILFLEGVRFPFRSVRIDERINTPPSISIAMTPTREIMDIKYRTTIHLFYEKSPGDYRLLFEGEVINHSYNRSPSSRSMTVLGTGSWNYMLTSKAYYFTDLAFGGGGTISEITDPRVNQTNEFTGKARITNSRARASMEAFNALIGQAFNQDGEKESEADPEKFILALLRQSAGTNEFNTAFYSRFRLGDRVSAVKDGQANKLYANSFLIPLITKAFTNPQSGGSMLGVIAEALGVMFYDMIFLSSPALTRQKTNSETGEEEFGVFLTDMIAKPHTAYTAPPMCNVMLPNEITQFSYQKGGMFAEPTRVRMTTPISFDGGGAQVRHYYYSPVEMRSVIKIIADTNRDALVDPETGALLKSKELYDFSHVLNRAIFTDDFDNEYTFLDIFNEDLKGIIPAELQLRSEEYAQANQDTDNSEAFDSAMTSLVQYHHLNRIYQGRTVSVALGFKPGLVAGFPGMIVDKDTFLFGEVAAVTHLLDSEGVASTSATLTYAHESDVFGQGGSGTGLVDIPIWYNESFYPDNALAAYQELLGVNSVMDTVFRFTEESVDRIVKILNQNYTVESDDGPVTVEHVIKTGDRTIKPRTLVGAAYLFLEQLRLSPNEGEYVEENFSRPTITMDGMFEYFYQTETSPNGEVYRDGLIFGGAPIFVDLKEAERRARDMRTTIGKSRLEDAGVTIVSTSRSASLLQQVLQQEDQGQQVGTAQADDTPLSEETCT
jgi:hypothetical protein